MMAQGLQLFGAHVETLDNDAVHLHQEGRRRSAEVLDGLADEEAAKVMMLLDIARAGWEDTSVLDRAFRAFRNHLARGLYVEAYEGRPFTLGDVRQYVDVLRRKFYLDGPNDVDWIFRNQILDRRESRLYVDLIADDEDRLTWTSPADRDNNELFDSRMHRTSWIVQLTRVMRRVGLLTEQGLTATEEAWRGAELNDDTHWRTVAPLNAQVLRRLDQLQPSPPYPARDGRDIEYVIDHWIFPIAGLELTQADVKVEQLRRQQQEWLYSMEGW